ncbi:MAG: hypothetical protein V7785_19865 [Bermanella sp.]
MIKPIFFIGLTSSFLLGCGSDNETEDVSSTFSFADTPGEYSVAFTRNNQAWLAKLAIHDLAATLSLHDELDNVEAMTGRYQNAVLSFSESQSCLVSADLASCELNGESLELTKISQSDAQTELSKLAGDYDMMSGAQRVSVTVDAQGIFSADLLNCAINGQFSMQENIIRLEETQNTCNDHLVNGVAYTSELYDAYDTLQVILPESALSGYWIK